MKQSVLIEFCCFVLIGITLRQGAQMKDWKLKKGELYAKTMRTTAVLPVKTRRETEIGTNLDAVRETETGTITANLLGTAGGAAGTDTGTVARTITLTRYVHCLSPFAMATVCFLCFSFLLYGLWEFLISNIVWMNDRKNVGWNDYANIMTYNKIEWVLTQDIMLVWYPRHIKCF